MDFLQHRESDEDPRAWPAIWHTCHDMNPPFPGPCIACEREASGHDALCEAEELALPSTGYSSCGCADRAQSGQVEGATSSDVASPNGQTLICDRCKEPATQLEGIGECEGYQDWCFECIRTEVGRMVEEQQRDDEMRSLKGYYSGELDRI
jgi:hypothetical protein